MVKTSKLPTPKVDKPYLRSCSKKAALKPPLIQRPVNEVAASSSGPVVTPVEDNLPALSTKRYKPFVKTKVYSTPCTDWKASHRQQHYEVRYSRDALIENPIFPHGMPIWNGEKLKHVEITSNHKGKRFA